MRNEEFFTNFADRICAQPQAPDGSLSGSVGRNNARSLRLQ